MSLVTQGLGVNGGMTTQGLGGSWYIQTVSRDVIPDAQYEANVAWYDQEDLVDTRLSPTRDLAFSSFAVTLIDVALEEVRNIDLVGAAHSTDIPSQPAITLDTLLECAVAVNVLDAIHVANLNEDDVLLDIDTVEASSESGIGNDATREVSVRTPTIDVAVDDSVTFGDSIDVELTQ